MYRDQNGSEWISRDEKRINRDQNGSAGMKGIRMGSIGISKDQFRITRGQKGTISKPTVNMQAGTQANMRALRLKAQSNNDPHKTQIRNTATRTHMLM